MAAFFRFLLTLFFGWDRYPTKNLLDRVTTRHRVRFGDLDLNWHVNNARYLSYLDSARLEHSIRTGVFGVFRRKQNFLVANIAISYYRSLLPRQHFEIDTRIVGWDDRYYYIEHAFRVGDTIYSHAWARLVFTEKGKRVAPGLVLSPLNHDEPSPPLPEGVLHWQAMFAANRAGSAPDNKKAA